MENLTFYINNHKLYIYCYLEREFQNKRSENMKKIKILVITAMVMTLASTSLYAKKPKVQNDKLTIQRLDWQGSTTGRDIPEWVDYVVDGDVHQVAKKLDIDEKKYKIFVVTEHGKNLQFVKDWAETVGVNAQVQRTMSSVVSSHLNANASGGEEDYKRNQDTATKLCGLVSLSGLEKKNQYWIQTRKAKTTKAKTDRAADWEDPVYTYYLVYVMGLDEYNNAVSKAMDEAYNQGVITDEAGNLKAIMLSALASDMIPGAANAAN